MIEMIVACGLDGAIGKNNKLLWKLKDDMKHFFKLTRGRNVVMGRKTFNSLQKPLIDRHNYVISNSTNGHFKINDTTAVTFLTYEQFLELQLDDYVIIGGSQIYELFKANVDTIWVTLVFGIFPKADTFIPTIDPAKWMPHEPEFHPADERNDYPFHIVKMTRR